VVLAILAIMRTALHNGIAVEFMNGGFDEWATY
jgi:hypothetical protein